jgi:hypothetical protein
MLVFRLPHLESIDGIDISEEERAKADLFFIDQLQVYLFIHYILDISVNIPLSQTSPAALESYGAFQGNWKVGAKVIFCSLLNM